MERILTGVTKSFMDYQQKCEERFMKFEERRAREERAYEERDSSSFCSPLNNIIRCHTTLPLTQCLISLCIIISPPIHSSVTIILFIKLNQMNNNYTCILHLYVHLTCINPTIIVITYGILSKSLHY